MSTKIGIITEGSIDHVLLPVLLSRIASERVGIDWPIHADDIASEFRIRKRGHGGVLESVRNLVKALDTTAYDHHCFVILLDRKTRPVQEKIANLITGRDRFVLGIAIEEMEAWWLGDRSNTLSWIDLTDEILESCRYAAPKYKAETDGDPKKTLSELTERSDRFDRVYGEGSVDLAQDFADNYWKDRANLDEIVAQCPKGYKPFERKMVNVFRPLRGNVKE